MVYQILMLLCFQPFTVRNKDVVSSRGPVSMDVFISLELTPSMTQSGHMEGVCV